MRFHFNQRKAAQAAAYLAELSGGEINMLVLLKLLYLADRKTLIEIGQTITGDKIVNMDKGPVLSGIYDLMKFGEEIEENPWFEFLTESSRYQFSLKNNPPQTDELSDYERDVLKDTHDKYGALRGMALVRLIHQLPEYRDPKGTSIPLDPADILRAASKSEEDIRMFADQAEEIYFLATLEQANQ